jgi:hypothetical protein
MRWKKLGRIFDPTEHSLPGNCSEFAQSPQVLLVGDTLRVFFSTREKDSSGKYLSRVTYADFDKSFELLSVAGSFVIDLGKLGCYDEHGIFPLNVLRTEDGVLGYIGGWNRRVSVSVDGSIGLARSTNDGADFSRVGPGPVLSSSINEPFLIGDPFVQIFDGTFHMWYIFGTKWMQVAGLASAERVYKIGHATSPDGLVWEKPREGVPIVTDTLGMDESQALPSVAKIGGMYHMVFCFRQSVDFRGNSDRGYRFGYASSEDLVNWSRDDERLGIDLSSDGWDSEMLCYPHLFEVDANVYLMYNGNQFGRFGFGVAQLESV